MEREGGRVFLKERERDKERDIIYIDGRRLLYPCNRERERRRKGLCVKEREYLPV